MGVVSSENTKVRIYLDDGTGQPQGNPVWNGRFVRSVIVSGNIGYELIYHVGYSAPEIVLSSSTYSIQLEKLVDGTSGNVSDLRLTDALYYIEIEAWSDIRDMWVLYSCVRCRRINWEITVSDTGALVCRASFVSEQVNLTELN